MDGKVWIECSGCQKWNHTECEINEGDNEEMRKLCHDFNKQSLMPEGPEDEDEE